MAESALYRSYRATEKRRAEQALDEALGRLEAQPAQPAAEPAISNASGTLAPPTPEQAGVRQPGVFESIKRGLKAIPTRFMEGVKEAGAGLRWERGEGPMDPGGLDEFDSTTQKILKHPATRFVLGATNVLFPFSAFAGETGGDATEYFTRLSGQMTDTALRQRLAIAEANAPQGTIGENAGELSGVDQASGEATMIRGLLAIPEQKRLEQVRQFGSLSAEVLSGIIPGYTSTGKPPEPPRR